MKKEAVTLTVRKEIYHDDNGESYQIQIRRLINQLKRLGWDVEQKKEGVKV